MKYNLERTYNKQGSYKWENIEQCFGKSDLFPMWIGDMDFPVPNEVVLALKEKCDNPFLGYTFLSNGYYESIINWMKRRHNLDIVKEDILFVPSIVQGINYAVRYLTKEDDEIILQSPIYPYFYSAISNNKRKVVDNPLKITNEGYKIDFQHLKSIINEKTKMMLLCSPHNPVGRVWTVEELNELIDICRQHDIIIISDEVFQDLVFKDYKHNPTALYYDKVVTFVSTSKTFNYGGIQAANAIIQDRSLKEIYTEGLAKEFVWAPNSFVETAVKTAYNKCEDYVEQVVEYIEENINIAIQYMKKNINSIKVYNPESTYFLWLDFSSTNMNSSEIDNVIMNKCKYALESGVNYGCSYEKFRRVNVACKRSDLMSFLQNLNKYFQ